MRKALALLLLGGGSLYLWDKYKDWEKGQHRPPGYIVNPDNNKPIVNDVSIFDRIPNDFSIVDNTKKDISTFAATAPAPSGVGIVQVDQPVLKSFVASVEPVSTNVVKATVVQPLPANIPLPPSQSGMVSVQSQPLVANLSTNPTLVSNPPKTLSFTPGLNTLQAFSLGRTKLRRAVRK